MSYDVFVSYSHEGDDLLSERVQDGLARFAKPWWRRRALNVFRDRTGLSANPGLWSSIAEAIDDSRFFLMLASPEAAASPWVAREIAQWRAKHGSGNLLMLLTEGEIVWDNDANDFDWQHTTALGAAAFGGCFLEEPRHVDMRWARSEVQLDLTDGRFRDQIAELAAPVHGMAKDDLAGEDVRQHRRTLRHAWAAGAALVLLTLAAVGTSVFAVNTAAAARRSAAAARRSEARARDEQRRADEQAGLASSASLVATKERNLAEQRRRDADGQRGLALARQREAQSSATEAGRQRVAAQQSATRAQQQQAAAQQSATEADRQRAAAQESATEADRQRAAAQESATEADRQRTLAEARAGQLTTANGNLVTLNGKLVDQRTRTDRQRLAGVARQLLLGSQSAVNNNAVDRGIVLAAEATRFSQLSGDLIPRADLQGQLLAALQRDPSVVTWLQGLSGPIADVAVTSDGTRAAALGVDGRVGVWSLSDFRLLASFPGPSLGNANYNGEAHVAFADAATIVVAGAQHLAAFRSDAVGARWSPLWSWSSPTACCITALAAAPSGNVAVMTLPDSNDFDMRVHTFDGRGHAIATIRFDRLGVTGDIPYNSISMSPDGQQLAVATVSGGNTLRVYSTTTGTLLRSFPTREVEEAVRVRYSADGSRLAMVSLRGRAFGLDGFSMLRVDLSTGGVDVTNVGPPVGATSSEPIAVSANLDRVAFQYSTDAVHRADLLGVYTLASRSFVGGLSAPLAPSYLPGGDAIGAKMATFSNDATLLGAGGDGAVPVLASSGRARSDVVASREIGPVGGPVRLSVLSPDATMLFVVDSRNTAHVVPLSPSTRRLDVALRMAVDQVTFGDTSDAVAVRFADGTVDLLSTRTGAQMLHLLGPRPRSATCLGGLSFSGTASFGRIADAIGSQLRVWDFQGGVLAGHQDLAVDESCPFGYGGAGVQLVAGGERLVVQTTVLDNTSLGFTTTVHIYDARTPGWDPIRTIVLAENSYGLSSPDGHHLVATNGTTMTMYDLDSGGAVWSVPTSDQSTVFDGNGTTVVSIPVSFQRGPSPVLTARAVANGSVTYTLAPLAGENIGLEQIVVTTDRVIAVEALPPDARTSRVTEWRIDIPSLVHASCRLANRNLTLAEWAQYVGTFDAYEKTCPNLP